MKFGGEVELLSLWAEWDRLSHLDALLGTDEKVQPSTELLWPDECSAVGGRMSLQPNGADVRKHYVAAHGSSPAQAVQEP